MPAPEPVLTCTVSEEVAELVGVMLFEAGALAVSETPQPAGVELRAGFASESQAADAVAVVAPWTSATVTMVTPTWQDEQRAGFIAQHIGPWFVTTHDDRTPAPEGLHHLRIDPGRAFGHGAHPTTRLILELLPDAITADSAVIDIGTGTGILSIAAATLGATVSALDIDPIAVATARENVDRNGVGSRVAVELTDGATLRPSARTDVALVNVTIDQHRRIAPHLAAVDTIIVSGLLEHQLDEAVNAYGCERQATRTADGWVAAVLKQPT